MNREEWMEFYQENIYGTWRCGETVTYVMGEDHAITICVQAGERKAEFTIKVQLPVPGAGDSYDGGSPFLVCMHPIPSEGYALEHGYAVLTMDSYQIASDDYAHKGAFYELYPYDGKQTGVLMAWAWGASKVLDAVYAGLDRELGLNAEASLVTGVSRWGKATAVCGAFEKRFRMVIPACSGAGGLALYDVVSTGKKYDFRSIGGPEDYIYGDNEPLSCLQSGAERGWFVDRFLQYRDAEAIPVSQSMLPVLAADESRFYFIIGACMKEDWVNAPAMWECFKRAEESYREMGLSDHLVEHFHAEGHAVIEEDMRLLIDYFNHMYYGQKLHVSMWDLKTSVFDIQ